MSKTKTITLDFSRPKLKTIIGRWSKLSKKVRLVTSGSVIVILLIIIGILLSTANQDLSAATTANPGTPSKGPPKLVRGTPNYSTILPKGKTIDKLGGWTRISPPNKNPVYTYVDKIGNVQIKVSEQPLPKTFQSDTASKIAQLAESYNATDKFTASDNTLVYVGSAGNAGEQSLILTKDRLLILIKSAGPISNDLWTTYVSSLR